MMKIFLTLLTYTSYACESPAPTIITNCVDTYARLQGDQIRQSDELR